MSQGVDTRLCLPKTAWPPTYVEGLTRWRDLAPYAARSAPSSEHLDPLFVALGARAPDDRPVTLYDRIHHGNLAMRSFALRPAGPPAGQTPAA